MTEVRRFDFFSKDRRDPYIQEIIDYNITKKEAYIHFNGYYYVLNEEFPVQTFLNMSLIVTSDFRPQKLVEDKYFMIEIYDREKIKNTSECDEMPDEDGSMMKVCLFPTHEQKIYFRIIKEFDSFEEFLDGCKEYFTKELGQES